MDENRRNPVGYIMIYMAVLFLLKTLHSQSAKEAQRTLYSLSYYRDVQ